ncbi:histidinol-phosphatase HisJ [Peribacillus sp. SCS-155]|uniref:histidinol-phosphatase HisJ n=1 Tax=Peribacillus sedimenti TaxID=3115297 RepID=UPI0039060790
MKFDGHIHSPYCPHGSSDQFEEYIERAVQLGMNEISFTEHAPLPKGFSDPTPDQDSGMDWEQLLPYIKDLKVLKEYNKKRIKINIGLEVDFIEGFEQETKELLDEIGGSLDDSILSVHFIKHEDSWLCIDFSEDLFYEISRMLGGVDEVHQQYYSTVKQSIHADLGKYKPTRIGHITLATKFQKKYPASRSFDSEVFNLLHLIHSKNYSLDYNGAGKVKPLCGETYPSEKFASYAAKLGIPLIYGSDAHTAKGLAQGFEGIAAAVEPSLNRVIR